MNGIVFTLEDDDFFRDDDILVISNAPSSEVIVPLEDEVSPGKNVQVTGIVRPFDREYLECRFGPLDVESWEGHSFMDGPVLVVEKVRPAPPIVRQQPPIPELPKTGSGLPLTALSGLLAIAAACGLHFRRR
jgi:LPXTG-motif cell wall-anchored protein